MSTVPSTNGAADQRRLGRRAPLRVADLIPVEAPHAPLEYLPALDQHALGGRRSFAGFRALIVEDADAALALAHQLRAVDAEVECCAATSDDQPTNAEMSATIATRAAGLGVAHRLRVYDHSAADVLRRDREGYDYINAAALLLDPAQAQRMLALVRGRLRPGGAVGLRFAGRVAQTGIAEGRRVVRLVARDDEPAAVRREIAREILETLPPSHGLRRWRQPLARIYGSDERVQDLLTAASDASWTMTDVHSLLAGADLHFAQFTAARRPLYQAQAMFKSAGLAATFAGLSLAKRHAAAELFWGCLTEHELWAADAPRPQSAALDAAHVPIWTVYARRLNAAPSITACQDPVWQCVVGEQLGMQLHARLRLDEATREFVRLIDGRRTIATIVQSIEAAGVSRQQALQSLGEAIRVLGEHDLLCFRHSGVEALPE